MLIGVKHVKKMRDRKQQAKTDEAGEKDKEGPIFHVLTSHIRHGQKEQEHKPQNDRRKGDRHNARKDEQHKPRPHLRRRKAARLALVPPPRGHVAIEANAKQDKQDRRDQKEEQIRPKFSEKHNSLLFCIKQSATAKRRTWSSRDAGIS
jgi:hypothetical protein